MNRFRRSFAARLIALALIAGLGIWASAPLATAHPEVAAANTARTHAAGPLESAIAEALSAAARSHDAVGTFEEVLRGSLEAHPDGAPLVALLERGASPAEMLDLLVGSLWRSVGLPSPALIAAAPTSATSAASPGLRGEVHSFANATLDPALSEPAQWAMAPREAVSLRTISAAQPLGP